MPVTEILLLRHGHRMAWMLDPSTGEYSSTHPFPTGLPADPPLAAHGVGQAEETGVYFSKELSEKVAQDRLRIYSSLFYRCLETLRPTVLRLREEGGAAASNLTVRGERGVGEWFGKAWFEQPAPAEPARLREEFFPFLDDQYQSLLIPDRHGERIVEVHDRLAKALSLLVKDVDREYEKQGRADEPVTLLLCGHAAQIVSSGRVLTGLVPDDLDEDDFQCYTCGISKFVRRDASGGGKEWSDSDYLNWKTNGGVAGGWDCVLNSWCGHLRNGEERGWHFHGDESFDSYGAGAAQGPIVADGSFASPKDGQTSQVKL
ncbi:putative phosphoglycerate mutase family protein [Eutypa lata UCREL1]|uniref:Putative phosphoglycerate mutase family protein n=1 Tax=Eutypa lata (strain UCR-EL1) TaxID=1287681 RepID=M7SF62_EUTLA|nr:putative phosphoglycerate mutase family protein [Eutypa lata UCREL1]